MQYAKTFVGVTLADLIENLRNQGLLIELCGKQILIGRGAVGSQSL